MIRKSSRVHSDLWVTRFEGRKAARVGEQHRLRIGTGEERGLNLSRPRLENATNVSPKYSDTKEESAVVVFRANSLSNKWLPFLQRTSLFRPLSYFARWKSIKSPSAMSAHRSHSRELRLSGRILMEFNEMSRSEYPLFCFIIALEVIRGSLIFFSKLFYSIQFLLQIPSTRIFV